MDFSEGENMDKKNIRTGYNFYYQGMLENQTSIDDWRICLLEELDELQSKTDFNQKVLDVACGGGDL